MTCGVTSNCSTLSATHRWRRTYSIKRKPLSTGSIPPVTSSCLRLPFPVSRLYASPLLRARQTVEALGLKDPVLDARLMEQNWGAWEELTRAEILSQHGADAFAKAGLRESFRPGGGESTGELH